MGNTPASHSVVRLGKLPQGWIVTDLKKDENSVLFRGSAKLFLPV